MANKPDINTLAKLEAVFSSILLLKDSNIIKLVIGAIVANQIDGLNAVWLLLVSSPSGGKSEILQALNDIVDSNTGRRLIYPISDMTINTFASGQVKIGEEASLLHKMPRGGILSFKDFTSMLSKNMEAKMEIMGQLREIYDGAYTKRTGNNRDINWHGKVGAIAGCTEVVYEHLESMSVMGDRFAMYSIEQPDRTDALKFIINATRSGQNKEELRAAVRAAVKEYTEFVLNNIEQLDLSISEEIENEIIEISDFCTRVRSGVIMDKKYNRVEFVPSTEMPMRLSEQLIALATAFVAMRKVESGGESTSEPLANDMAILRKIAFDSIPIKRRIALKILATYAKGATTAGIATTVGYQTPVIAGWLAQLNGLGICNREKRNGNQGDLWNLRDEYVKTMVKFEHVKVIEEKLEDEGLTEADLIDAQIANDEEIMKSKEEAEKAWGRW